MRSIYLLFLFISILFSTGRTQNRSADFEQFTIRNGLAHNTVISLFIQQNGILWASTMDGISRIDATGITSYKSNQFEGLSSGFIHAITDFSADTLLLITRDQGFVFFQPSRNSFWPLKPKIGKFENKSYAFIKQLISISKSKKYVLTGTKKQFILNSDGTVDDLPDFPEPINEYTSVQWIVSRNQLISGYDKHLTFMPFDGNSLQAEKSFQILLDDFLKEDSILDLFLRPDEVWIQTQTRGLFLFEIYDLLNSRINPKQILLNKDLGFKPKRISSKEKYVFLFSNNSDVAKYEFDSKKLSILFTKEVTDNYFNAAVQDAFGNVWLSSWGDGLFKLKSDSDFHQIPSFRTVSKVFNPFNLGIMEDKFGSVWLLNSPGLLRWNPETNHFSAYGNEINKKHISFSSAWQLRESDLGIWVATNNIGLLLFKTDQYNESEIKENPTVFSQENRGLASNRIAYTIEDSFGRFWVSHHDDGIQVFESEKAFISKNTKEMGWYKQTANTNQFSIPDRSARILFKERNGSVWAGTFTKGIIQLSDSTGKLSVWQPNTSDGIVYEHQDIRDIYESSNHDFWIATYGGGIIHWDRKAKKSEIITSKNGLSNDFTYAILAQNDTILWIPTNNGLSKFDTKSGQIHIYTESDGLQNNEFNTGAFYKGKSGKMYVGGVNGVNYFMPNEVLECEINTQISIVSVKAFNQNLMSRVFYENHKKIAYNENYLTFQYSSSDLTSPDLNRYSYRLIGLDTTWIDSGNRTLASFSNLDPGEYRFEVKGTNSNRIWSDSMAVFSFEIVPAMWMTSSFRFIIGGLFFVLFVFTIRYVSTQELRQKLIQLESEKKLQAERERISRDLHDHIGNQLANISSGIELVKKYNEHNQPEKASLWYKALKEDVAYTMQQLRETIWTLGKNEISADLFMERIEMYLRGRASDDLKLSAEFKMEDGKSPILLSPEISLNLFRIIQEAVQNSLKYAEARWIKVEFVQAEKMNLVLISDNGKYKEREKNYDGYGIKNMKNRALDIGGKLEIKKEPTGTVVEIKFGLKNKK